MKKREYSSSEHYIDEIKSNSDLYLVPIQVAADYLEVTAQTVNAYASNGQLIKRGIKGLRFSGIELGSIIDMEKRKEDELKKYIAPAKKILTSAAKKGRLVEYGKLMGGIGLDHQKSKDRKLLGKVLLAISKESMEVDKFMLSAIAVRQVGKRPNKSFYSAVVREGYWKPDNFEDTRSQERFFKMQLRRIEKRYERYKSKFVEVWEK